MGAHTVISRWSISVRADSIDQAEQAMLDIAASVRPEELEESAWANLHLESRLEVEAAEDEPAPELIEEAKQFFRAEAQELLRPWRLGELEQQGEDRLDNQASAASPGGGSARQASAPTPAGLPAYLSRLISSQGEAAAEHYLRASGIGLSLDAYFNQQLKQAAKEQPHLQGLIDRCREIDDHDRAFQVEILALAAAGTPGEEMTKDWGLIRDSVSGRLKAAGLLAQHRQVARQMIVDIAEPRARQRFLKRALDPESKLPIACCRPPDLIVFAGPAESQENFDYIMAHELAHKISFLHPEPDDLDDDESGWLMAEAFNDLRAIQLAPYNPGPMQAGVDSGLEIAYGLTQAAGLPLRATLEMSDYEMEERLAAGLSLSMGQWREQVTQPFDHAIELLRDGGHQGAELNTQMLLQGMSRRIQDLIEEHGPGFRSVPLLG